MCVTTVVEGFGNAIVEFDRPVEIGQSAIDVAEIESQAATIDESLTRIFLKRDCLIEISESALQISVGA